MAKDTKFMDFTLDEETGDMLARFTFPQAEKISVSIGADGKFAYDSTPQPREVALNEKTCEAFFSGVKFSDLKALQAQQGFPEDGLDIGPLLERQRAAAQQTQAPQISRPTPGNRPGGRGM